MEDRLFLQHLNNKAELEAMNSFLGTYFEELGLFIEGKKANE
jgi:hypothetical protein